MVELHELAHGILPAVLTRGGLRAGVAAFVTRRDLPVELDVTSERLHPDIEASAYFIVAEALTNVVKHASATEASVLLERQRDVLRVTVADDGVGGAYVAADSGLAGLRDRLEALDAPLVLETDPGRGTVVRAAIPCAS